jgi:hypothetical protein
MGNGSGEQTQWEESRKRREREGGVDEIGEACTLYIVSMFT